MDGHQGAERRSAHPALFFVLYFAFGVCGGFLSGAVQNVYTGHGVTYAQFGAVISIALGPQVVKVLWAPLVDTTLNPKAWFVLATGVLGTAILTASLLPVKATSLPIIAALAVVAGFAASFLGMSADSLMAHDTAPERRGAAGGWSQAGNLVGAGTGSAASLWVIGATHSLPLAALTVFGACALCSLALLFAPPSRRLPKQANYAATLALVVKDCWAVCRSRNGWLTLLLFVLPLGSGGALQLASGIYREWRASQDLLASSALLGAAATGVGALVGGYLCDRLDRKFAYALFSVFGGLAAAGAALAPLTPVWFLVFVGTYSGALGMAYAAYSAATLEAIGGGAAATKYTLFASVANVPVLIMPSVDGWVDTHLKIDAMLWTELAVALGGASIFAFVVWVSRGPAQAFFGLVVRWLRRWFRFPAPQVRS